MTEINFRVQPGQNGQKAQFVVDLSEMDGEQRRKLETALNGQGGLPTASAPRESMDMGENRASIGFSTADEARGFLKYAAPLVDVKLDMALRQRFDAVREEYTGLSRSA